MYHVDDALDALSEEDLYKLIGYAWVAQLKFDPGQAYYIAPAAETGRREFDVLAPILQRELAHAAPGEIVTIAARTIRHWCAWRMPASVVAALAAKRNLVPENNPASLRAGSRSDELQDQSQRARS